MLQNDANRNFHTVVTVYLPGEPPTSQKYENIKECTLCDGRIQFITADGRSIASNLPFLLERAPAW
ncbi:MAG TPA: hypothetical protein VMH85_18070 [Terriglobales bacterium]|nr:hypothetical protein [Terriglobales bacterium]